MSKFEEKLLSSLNTSTPVTESKVSVSDEELKKDRHLAVEKARNEMKRIANKFKLKFSNHALTGGIIGTVLTYGTNKLDIFGHGAQTGFVGYLSLIEPEILPKVNAELDKFNKTFKSDLDKYRISLMRMGKREKKTKETTVIIHANRKFKNPGYNSAKENFEYFNSMKEKSTIMTEQAKPSVFDILNTENYSNFEKVPQSLYEYSFKTYTPEDIQMLADSIKIASESWCTSKQVTDEKIKSAPLSVLCEDDLGSTIYSYNDNKIHYCHDGIVEPAMEITDFLDLAKEDLIAVQHSDSTKPYNTKPELIEEGIKEIFGYGQAIRIFLDCKVNKTQRVFDKHSLAIIDSMLAYSKNLLTPREFEGMLERNSILEVYENHKLGTRDMLRSMPADANAIVSETQMKLADIIKKYGDYDPKSLYTIYAQCRMGATCFEKCIPYLKKYINSTRPLQLSSKQHVDCYLREYINNPLLILGTYNPLLLSFDLDSYIRAGIASANNRLERFSNNDLLIKFESDMDAICKIITNICSQAAIKAYYIYRNTEAEVKTKYHGVCLIRFCDMSEILPYKYTAPMAYNAKQVTARINKKFMEYWMDPENNDLSWVTEDFDTETMENTLQYVQERETVRQIAHTIRAGAEKVSHTVGKVARNIKQITDPVMHNIRKAIDDNKKAQQNLDRDIVITDSTFLKMQRFFRYSLAPTVGAYVLFGPIKAVIAFFVSRFFKTDDAQMRDKIKRELEMELKLTREKIEDARSNGDNQSKYKLMRIENDLEDELARITYGHD
jgi:hypothetical protein